jgi:hypothetical protein
MPLSSYWLLIAALHTPLAVGLLISGFSNLQYGKQNSEAPSAKVRPTTLHVLNNNPTRIEKNSKPNRNDIPDTQVATRVSNLTSSPDTLLLAKKGKETPTKVTPGSRNSQSNFFKGPGAEIPSLPGLLSPWIS